VRPIAALPLVAIAAALPGCRHGENADATTVYSRAVYSTEGALVLCFDADARAKLHGGAWTVKDREEALSRVNSAHSAETGGGTTVTLEKGCTDAFPDHVELASCTAWDDAFAVHYYSFASLDKDREASCKKVLHGNWKSLPVDSEPYRAARARYEAERAERAKRAPGVSPGSSW
jgi:hypothetical protein